MESTNTLNNNNLFESFVFLDLRKPREHTQDGTVSEVSVSILFDPSKVNLERMINHQYEGNDLNNSHKGYETRKFAKETLGIPGKLTPKVVNRIQAFTNPKYHEQVLNFLKRGDDAAGDERSDDALFSCVPGLSFQNERFIKYKRKDKVNGLSFEITPNKECFFLFNQPISQGTFKKVKIILDSNRKALVARSTIIKEKMDKALFLNEIFIQNLFRNNVNFVNLLYTYITPDKYIIAAEYCNFGNLENLPPQYRNERILVPIIHEILHGLAEMDKEGVIHRDLKPANILVHKNPDGSIHAKISDFGTALLKGSFENAETGGTPTYFPPEYRPSIDPEYQSRKNLSHEIITTKGDLWSVGLVIYESFFSTPLYDKLFESLHHEEIKFTRDIYELLDMDQKTIYQFLNDHLLYECQCPSKFKDELTSFLKYIFVIFLEDRPDAEQVLQLFQEVFNLPPKK